MDEGKGKKKLSKGKVIGLIILALIVYGIASSAGKPKTKSANDSQTQTTNQAATESQAKPAEQKPTEKFAFDDGKHEIGKDIKAGTYRTKGTDGSAIGCYWARLSGFSGNLDEILANNGSYNGGSQVITIKDTDKGFETKGCGKWYAELTQVTASKTSFGPGTMIIGTDVEPGTYKNSGAKDQYSCYWARLSGFTGELDDILANENVQNTIVTISATDKGFSSSGCGTWAKQ